jgi:hypothetical protein
VPHESSVHLHEALLAARARSELRIYQGKNHTQFLLEDAMCSDTDTLLEEILGAVHGAQPARGTSHAAGRLPPSAGRQARVPGPRPGRGGALQGPCGCAPGCLLLIPRRRPCRCQALAGARSGARGLDLQV